MSWQMLLLRPYWMLWIEFKASFTHFIFVSSFSFDSTMFGSQPSLFQVGFKMFNWNLKNRNLCSCNCIRKCTFVHRRLWLKRTLSKTIKWTQIKFCQFSHSLYQSIFGEKNFSQSTSTRTVSNLSQNGVTFNSKKVKRKREGSQNLDVVSIFESSHLSFTLKMFFEFTIQEAMKDWGKCIQGSKQIGRPMVPTSSPCTYRI